MLRSSAGWLAHQDPLPTSLRAVLGYYAHSGRFDYASLRLKSRVERVTEKMIEDAFGAVEEAVADAFGYDHVDFAYDTKLVLPAQLTLGYLYRRLDPARTDRAEAVTRLSVEALIDGDMRDAINDREFDDFVVEFPTDAGDRERIAELAQDVLSTRVEEQFSGFDDGLRAKYDWAVEVSETHQSQDEQFRKLMSDARDGNPDTLERIRREYRDASFEKPPDLLTDAELAIPYLKTQYDRVGVIYDGMIGMYRAAGLPIEDAFHRSIVLAIIGAQIWLDDIDDYEADIREGQLTPVTAEYLLGDSQQEAHESIVGIGEQYLAHARDQATAADSTLTGIATEYIYRNGTPEELPGRTR